jgi:predicted DNA-binding transcriptional regulator AlpA
MRKTPARDTLPAIFTAERILSLAQAAELYGVSIATFRRLMRAGKLPSPIQLSERRIGWRAGDLIESIAAAKAA